MLPLLDFSLNVTAGEDGGVLCAGRRVGREPERLPALPAEGDLLSATKAVSAPQLPQRGHQVGLSVPLCVLLGTLVASWRHHHHTAEGQDSRSSLSACPGSSLSPYVDSIWALLLQNCECQEEGTRNLVAECLGKLTLVNAARLLPKLRQQLEAGRRPEASPVPRTDANAKFCSPLPQLLLWLAAQW